MRVALRRVEFVLATGLASDVTGIIPRENVRLEVLPATPRVDLILGPAVNTAGGTRWEVCVDATIPLHRVAFGLIAPAGKQYPL